MFLPRAAVAVVLVLVVPVVGLARADEDPDHQTDVAIARRHYDRGVEHFDRQQYELALAEFEAARKVLPNPAFDYNIAKCLEHLERWREAVDAYERFLAARPDDPDAPAKRERVKVLRQRIAHDPTPASRAASPAAATKGDADDLGRPVNGAAPAPTSAPSRRATAVAGYVLLGAGVAAAVTGGALLGLASSASSDVARRYSDGGVWTQADADRASAGRTFDVAGISALAAGGVLVVTGAVLAVLGSRPERSPVVTLAPRATGATLVLSCGF